MTTINAATFIPLPSRAPVYPFALVELTDVVSCGEFVLVLPIIFDKCAGVLFDSVALNIPCGEYYVWWYGQNSPTNLNPDAANDEYGYLKLKINCPPYA